MEWLRCGTMQSSGAHAIQNGRAACFESIAGVTNRYRALARVVGRKHAQQDGSTVPPTNRHQCNAHFYSKIEALGIRHQ